MEAVDHFGTDLPIHGAISCVDLKNLCLQVLVREADMIPEKLPYDLAGKSQLLEFLLCVVFPGRKTIDFIEVISAEVLALSI